MASNVIRLIIIAALEAEARPLIRRLELRPAPEDTVRRLFLGDRVALVVSGVGRKAAESAVKFVTLGESTRYALGRRPGGDGGELAWLNVGTGGHRDRPIGQGILAHRVEDAGWSRAWYPRFVFEPPCPTETVRTIDHVERNYLDPVVYEMEAAGFAAAASSTTPAELIHVYKVISDGAGAPVRLLGPELIEELIQGRVEEIAGVAQTLVGLADEVAGAHASPPGFDELCGKWHFTRIQQHQLRRLLALWKESMRGASPMEALAEARHPREVLLLLERALRLPPPDATSEGKSS